MPRNSSGTYTLPIGAFSPGGLIKSSDHNSNYSDIATALTQSLATTGVSTMTGQVKAAAGTVAAPAYTFGTSTTSGLWLNGTNQIGLATNGTQVATFNSDQSVTYSGAVTFNNGITVTASGATITGNSSVTGTLTASSTLTASNGFTVSAGTVTFPSAAIAVSAINIPDVTVQRFTSGTGLTYTAPAGLKRIRVRMCGGGGGGANSTQANNGSPGTDTSFGAWTAIHGNGGNAGTGGSGGTGGASGSGVTVFRQNGGTGPNGTGGQASTFGFGPGGFNPFAGPGVFGTGPIANTGAGGIAGISGGNVGGSGGAGEYVEFWMTAAQVGATQTYSVGTLGGGGAAGGGQAGQPGAAGIIIVEEFYT